MKFPFRNLCSLLLSEGVCLATRSILFLSASAVLAQFCCVVYSLLDLPARAAILHRLQSLRALGSLLRYALRRGLCSTCMHVDLLDNTSYVVCDSALT